MFYVEGIHKYKSRISSDILLLVVCKGVPVPGLECLWDTWSQGSTSSQPRHENGVSGQLHAPAGYYSQDSPGTHCTGGEWAPEPIWTLWCREKIK